MNKRGSSHVEMVLAFIFFVSFVSFIFIFVKPYEEKNLLDPSLSAVKRALFELSKTNYSEITLRLKAQQRSPCYEIDVSDVISHIPSGTIGISKDGNPIKTGSKVNSVQIEDRGKKDIRILISPEFKKNALNSCRNLQNKEYIIGSVFEKEYASNSTLHKIKEEYRKSYEILKSKLRIPKEKDFLIISPDFPEINMSRKIPSGVDVLSKNEVLEILNSKGKIINARVIIKVW